MMDNLLFESIESSKQFVQLLIEAIGNASKEIKALIERAGEGEILQHAHAPLIVAHQRNLLSTHLTKSPPLQIASPCQRSMPLRGRRTPFLVSSKSHQSKVCQHFVSWNAALVYNRFFMRAIEPQADKRSHIRSSRRRILSRLRTKTAVYFSYALG
jgi:hypothetical protein